LNLGEIQKKERLGIASIKKKKSYKIVRGARQKHDSCSVTIFGGVLKVSPWPGSGESIEGTFTPL
jgi:hypothetical protein